MISDELKLKRLYRYAAQLGCHVYTEAEETRVAEKLFAAEDEAKLYRRKYEALFYLVKTDRIPPKSAWPVTIPVQTAPETGVSWRPIWWHAEHPGLPSDIVEIELDMRL